MWRNESLYLKPDVLLEPLFNQWYAWPYLIAPASAAMYVANQHLKLMQSFVAAPQTHQAALRNPALLGGPFLNCDPRHAPEVKSLWERTIKEQQPLLALAESIRALDQLLDEEALGLSLSPLYARVPEPLRGCVELVYDANHRPSARLIEGLLYQSQYYNPAAQSLLLWRAAQDARSFVFSTPRLPETRQLQLSLPFAHAGLDELFKMRRTPQRHGFIKEQLATPDTDDELFADLFTDAPPPPPASYQGAGVRIRYFGHACLLIETAEVSLLCDPAISYGGAPDIERFTFADLPARLDYVLITHNHQDHCLLETLLQLRPQIGTLVVPKNNGGSLVDPSLKLALRQIGFRNVIELDEMESLEIPGGQIIGVPFLGEHADLGIRSKLAYWIAVKGQRLLCVADSENLEPKLYERIANVLGPADVLFVGMECDGAPLSWLYGALLTKPLSRKMDQTRRSNGSDFLQAQALVEQLSPTQVYVYAMGQEPWLTYLTSLRYTPTSRPIVESNQLIDACRQRGVTAERLYGQKEIHLPPRTSRKEDK